MGDTETQRKTNDPTKTVAQIVEAATPKAEITKEPVRIGRPAKYQNAEELTKKIEEYFDNMPTIPIVVGKGKNQQVIYKQTPTISGLSFHLGFADRSTIYDYKGKKEFTYILKRAVLAIERHYEEQLQGGVVVGSIFWLKVHGWQETQPAGLGDLDEFARLMKAVQNKSTGLPIIEAQNQLPGGTDADNSVEVTSPDDAETQKHTGITGV